MPATNETCDKPFLGMADASKLLGKSPSKLLHLAVLGQISHAVSPEGRAVFSAASIRRVRETLEPRRATA